MHGLALLDEVITKSSQMDIPRTCKAGAGSVCTNSASTCGSTTAGSSDSITGLCRDASCPAFDKQAVLEEACLQGCSWGPLICVVTIVQGLKDAAKKLLLAWSANNNNMWPQRLFFYRDGVSEGQFTTVQMLEIPQIRMACEEVSRRSNGCISRCVCIMTLRKKACRRVSM